MALPLPYWGIGGITGLGLFYYYSYILFVEHAIDWPTGTVGQLLVH